MAVSPTDLHASGPSAPTADGGMSGRMLDFLAYLEFERGLSRNTLEAYRSDLLQYGEWLRRTGSDPLSALGDLIAQCRDSKTLIGLALLRDRMRSA